MLNGSFILMLGSTDLTGSCFDDAPKKYISGSRSDEHYSDTPNTLGLSTIVRIPTRIFHQN